MLENLMKAISEKRFDKAGNGKNKEDIRIIFSNEGYQKALADKQAFRVFNLQENPLRTFAGYKFTVDREQVEDFIIEET
jgi:hypothetical protein